MTGYDTQKCEKGHDNMETFKSVGEINAMIQLNFYFSELTLSREVVYKICQNLRLESGLSLNVC